MPTDEKHRLDAARLRGQEGWSIGRAAQAYGVDPQDRPVKRVNWPRVAFAGLLGATVTILVTLRFQTTSERSLQAVSGGPSAAAEVSFPPKADLPSTLQLVAEPASEGTDRRSLRPFYFSFASSRAAAFQRLRVKPASAKRRPASRSPRWKRSSGPNSCSEPHEASRSPTRDRPSTTERFGLRKILPPLRPCSATMRARHRALFT